MMIKMNNIQKAAFCSFVAMMAITMITSNQLSTYASPTTEDDGYTYPDDSGDEEKEEIDEQEQEAWEDAGRPGDRNDDDDEKDNGGSNNDDESPSIENAPALAVQNTAVNETRWYNNCEGGGKQAGGGLQFDTFAYENCESHANGDKAYYDGFVQGCMGIDNANTNELCEAFIVGCLRAQTVDYNESCDVAIDTSSAEWKIVMVLPAYQDSV